MRATDLLMQDHRGVKQLFAQLEAAAPDGRQTLLDQIGEELDIHTKIEEEIFYPAVRRVSGLVDEAKEEHDEVASCLSAVQGRDPASQEFMTGVRELKGKVEHHVAEEEGPMFRDAERLGAAELERLGTELAQRKETLKTSLLHRGVRAVKQAAQKAV